VVLHRPFAQAVCLSTAINPARRSMPSSLSAKSSREPKTYRPPVLVRRMVPSRPTTVPVLASTKETAESELLVPLHSNSESLATRAPLNRQLPQEEQK